MTPDIDVARLRGLLAKAIPLTSVEVVHLVNALPTLLDTIDALQVENARLKEVIQPFADIGKRKANLYIMPDDPIVITAIKAVS